MIINYLHESGPFGSYKSRKQESEQNGLPAFITEQKTQWDEQQNIQKNIPPESHPDLPEQTLNYSC